MPTGPDLPSTAMLMQIAADHGLDLTTADAESYRALMAGAIESYRKLEAYAEPKPAVTYPRDGGWRPRPEDNPCNGWYWRCNIAGAAGGVLKGQRVAVKDVACIAGIPMTIGTSLLDGFVPDVDVTIVRRILDAGGTIVGTTNCEAFAFSGAGHTCNHGRCATRTIPRTIPAGPPAAAPWCWRPARPTWRSAATRAARSASPPRGPASSASSPHSASCPIPAAP